MTSLRTAFAYSLLSSNGVFFLQFVGTLIIARLITPEEFGIFSVASVVVGISQIFRDMGVSSYLVQAKELDSSLLRSASGIAILSAAIIGTLIWVLSSPIASFYGEPSVAAVMQILALNFLLTPFGLVTMACIRREMRFREIAIINLCSTVASLVTSCILAWKGFGAVGLAWGPVAGTAVNILFALRLRPSYLPWGIAFSRWRDLLGFGSQTTVAFIIGYLNMASADLLLGKLASMEALGIFNRAATLSRFFFNLIMQGLNPVLLPAFARMRHESGDIRQSFIDIAVRVCGVAWPAFAVIAVLAEPLVVTLFGEQWLPAAPLVPFICATAAISAVYSSCSVLHTARGKPHLNVVIESINLPIKVIAITVAAPFGLIFVAAVWPVIALCGAMVHQWVLAREIRLGIASLYQPLIGSLLLAIVSAATAAATIVSFNIISPNTTPILLTVSALGCAIASWLITTYTIHHPIMSDLEHLRRKAYSLIIKDKII